MSFQEKYQEYKQRKEAKAFFNQNNAEKVLGKDYLIAFLVGTGVSIVLGFIMETIIYKTGINFSYLVSKQLDLTAVNYIDFSQALSWLENNYSLINHLFGEAYNIKSWKMAFYDAAQSDSKKIFIEMD